MGEDDVVIIRAGFKSTSFCAGSACVDIAGTFTRQDAEDAISLLEMSIRQVRRQVEGSTQPK